MRTNCGEKDERKLEHRGCLGKLSLKVCLFGLKASSDRNKIDCLISQEDFNPVSVFSRICYGCVDVVFWIIYGQRNLLAGRSGDNLAFLIKYFISFNLGLRRQCFT